MTGLSFYTAQPLERDSMIVQVPRELCITSSSALEATQLILTSITGSSSVLQPDSLPAPDWILLYLVLSRLAEEFLAIAGESGPPDDIADLFEHLPYVSRRASRRRYTFRLPSWPCLPTHRSSDPPKGGCARPLSIINAPSRSSLVRWFNRRRDIPLPCTYSLPCSQSA